MGIIATSSCEPFRAWNRLEPRSRKEDFDKTLQAGVYDALWFLTRQWQFGEFKGEDTGSAIFSKIHMQTTQLSHFKPFNSSIAPYSDATPLEKTIERTAAPLNDKIRIQSGKYARKLLAKNAAGIASFNQELYRPKLKTLYPYKVLDQIQAADDSKTILSKARKLSNAALTQFNDFFVEEDFDGYLLYADAKANLAATAGKISLQPDHLVSINKSLQDYIILFEDLYADELRTVKGSWNPAQLEYQTKLLLPEEDNTKTIISADEYYTGNLDWYAFDIDKTTVSGTEFQTTSADNSLLKDTVLTMIPTEARFAGMPNSRWWQFENGAVDLVNYNADTTDLANLIFSEFAFLYSNDWLIVPILIEVGTLAEIKGIVIKDVFGEYEFIKSASQGNSDNWTAWGMFNLSVKHDVSDKTQVTDTRLFIPPSVIKTNESVAVEQLHFLRDEMANMVWGIETYFDNGLGRGMDGHVSSNDLQNFLEKISPAPVPAKAADAAFSYRLGNTVPENWIPFIPTHILDGQNRAIRFQRAAMPRTFKGINSPIRPNTTLLREGINNGTVKPYYINEEEIPRAGVRVFSSYQRTRWYQGKTENWFGNRKTLGRGEGSSGLQFDQLVYAPKA